MIIFVIIATHNYYFMENRPDKFRILIVDDEEDICEILQYNLQKAGYHADTASCAEEALCKIKNGYNLLLLDIMMDGISGLKMAQLLRDDYHNNIPIIFISALSNEKDIVAGFDKGGDDYIAKPFSVKEVLARVNAVLARCYPAGEISSDTRKPGHSPAPKQECFEHCSLRIEYDTKRVIVDGEEIPLTKKEYEILVLVSKTPKKIFSREDILQMVWKEESYVLERTVDVHIARLRKKIGKYGDLIVNRSGYGYSMHL